MKLPDIIDPSKVSFASTPSSEQSVLVNLRPLGLIADSTTVTFNTGSHADVLIDPASLSIAIKIKVTSPTDTNLTKLKDTEFMMAANGMLNSFFTGITVKINNQQVYQSNHHNFVSYLRTLVNTTSDFRSSVLSSAGWFEVPTAMDVASYAGKKFRVIFDESRVVTLVGRLDCPFFESPKLLPPSTDLTISLARAAEEQFLVTDVATGAKLHLIDAELQLRYVKPEPQLLSALNTALKSTPYLYPYKHIETRSVTLPAGVSTYSVPNLHIGRTPSMVLFTLLLTSDYKGDLKRSPYIFSASTLNAFNFTLNGCRVPVTDLKFETTSASEIVPLFHYVNSQLALDRPGTTPNLTLAKYAGNFFFVAQNLIKDVSVNSLSAPGRGGSLSLDLAFKTALTASHTLLLLSEFSKSVLSFNADNSVSTIQQ